MNAPINKTSVCLDIESITAKQVKATKGNSNEESLLLHHSLKPHFLQFSMCLEMTIDIQKINAYSSFIIIFFFFKKLLTHLKAH